MYVAPPTPSLLNIHFSERMIIWGFHISHKEIVYHERLQAYPIQRLSQKDEVIERSKTLQLQILLAILDGK